VPGPARPGVPTPGRRLCTPLIAFLALFQMGFPCNCEGRGMANAEFIQIYLRNGGVMNTGKSVKKDGVI